MFNKKYQLNQSLDSISNRNKSKQKTLQHRLLSTKGSLLNDRVQKIKNKYGTQQDLKQSFLDYQSTLYQSVQLDKQNNSSFLNCSIQRSCLLTNKLKIQNGKVKTKQMKKQQKQQKIQKLQQINTKISILIENLKKQDEQSQTVLIPKLIIPHQNQHNINYYSVCSPKNFISRIQTLQSQSRRSASKRSQSLKRCNQQKQGRQNGKILSRNKSMASSMAEIKYHNQQKASSQNQTVILVKYLSRQIQYDEIFLKYKTQAMKMGKKVKHLIENALKKSDVNQDQKKLVLDWNLQEMDPLYTERYQNSQTNTSDINLLVFSVIDSFLKSQHHWRMKLINKFNRKKLCLNDLDVEGKGYFLKQDLTRFVSLKSKKMYCNRQISLIFKRINKTKGKIVPSLDLLNTFCN